MADETPVAKPWYTSKIMWVNAIALIAMVLQGVTGNVIISAEIQATILSVINIVLRIVTKKPVVWA